MTRLPALVRPMLATAGRLPPAAEDDRWGYEMKWDGVRAVVYIEGPRVRVMTRNDREVAATYPELAGLADALSGRPAILDGEVVAFDGRGRPSFGLLQQRMHVAHPSADLLRAVPVRLLLFDLLHSGGRSLLGETYRVRRAALEDLTVDGRSVATPAAFEGDGGAALTASRQAGLEGVVAKRLDSAYEPGTRSRAWLKVKHLRMQEVVLGGWKPGEGWRSGGIGSLLLGVPVAGGLRFAGHVGTGFTVAMLDDLAARLRPLERPTSPFVDEVPRQYARLARWVEPEVVGEVAYSEWTRDGRLRHPVWRGLRPDKTAADVVPEEG